MVLVIKKKKVVKRKRKTSPGPNKRKKTSGGRTRKREILYSLFIFLAFFCLIEGTLRIVWSSPVVSESLLVPPRCEYGIALGTGQYCVARLDIGETVRIAEIFRMAQSTIS